MHVGIPKEAHPGEGRVAATPDTVGRLVGLGFTVLVQEGAGQRASFVDAAYIEAGAEITTHEELWSRSQLILKVRAPELLSDGRHETDLLTEGSGLVCLIFPAGQSELLERLAARRITTLALDQVPRISRAQKMDVLSSMANIAGYRAIIEAAHHYRGCFSGQITAAGRTRPAQVLVIGAGVAGLAAVAAARSLGAEVQAFDVRPAVKEQVESLGASFLEVDFEEEEAEAETKGGYAKQMSEAFIAAEMALFLEQARKVDIVVTTALIPGKKAPILFTQEMVEAMRPGSIVVDMAAEQGGNCAATVPEQATDVGGVTVIGYTDLTSRLATHASQFFGTNLVNLIAEMGGADFEVDLEDEVVRKSLVTYQGEVTWPPPPDPEPEPAAQPSEPAPAPEAAAPETGPAQVKPSRSMAGLKWVALVLVFGAIGAWAPDEFIQRFTVFILACFVGWQVIWNVSHALHTPLMSVTNAISGIIVVGGILQASLGTLEVAPLLGAVAILVASINIVGGFLVTQRMLQMFRRTDES